MVFFEKIGKNLISKQIAGFEWSWIRIYLYFSLNEYWTMLYRIQKLKQRVSSLQIIWG